MLTVDRGLGFSVTWEPNRYNPVPTTHLTSFTSTSGGIVPYPLSGEYPKSLVGTWLVEGGNQDEISGLEIHFPYLRLEMCATPEDPFYWDALILYQVN